MKKAVLRKLREMESKKLEAEVKVTEADNIELSLEQPNNETKTTDVEVKEKKKFGLKKKKSDK